MVSKVEKALSRFCMIVPEDRVLVALSGGGDSVALLYCLLELSKKRDFSLACAHLHHGIRGAEADRDEAFCRELCEKEGLFLAVEHRDIPRLAKERGISQELCGREERYAFFERVCEEYDLTKIATAHHLGDNAETNLLHLIRGTGLEGLRGIEPCRGRIIRPLLLVSKEEIEAFLEERKLSFREDSSNLSDAYTRNKIRSRVIPVLKELNPSFEEGIFRMNELILAENDYLEKCAKEAYEKMAKEGKSRVVLPLAPFLECHPAIRRRVLQLAFLRVTGQKPESGRALDIEKLALRGRPSKGLILGNAEAKIEYEKLIITKKKGENITEPYAFPLQIGGENTEILHLGYRIFAEILEKEEFSAPKIQKKFKSCLFNYDKIYDTVISRNRKTGDAYEPLGGAGRRTVKKMMIDEKIPRGLRGTLPVFACGEKVLWAYGLRINDAYKVTADTQKILQITVVEEKPDDE